MTRACLGAILVAALVGCSNVVTFMPLADPPKQPQPRQPDDVEMFITNGPTAPYVVVGLLQSGGGWASEVEMITILKREGGQRGCEGVLLARKVKGGNVDSQSITDAHGNVYTVNVRGGSHTMGLDAYCVMYTDAPGAASALAAEDPEPSSDAAPESSPTPEPAP
jgi:hypothetical protein